MVKSFSTKMLESTKAIAPIAILVLILGLTIIPLSWQCIVQYLLSCVFLIFGMSLFTLGADTAMIPVGQSIGSFLSKKNKYRRGFGWVRIGFPLFWGALPQECYFKVLPRKIAF